MTGLYVLIVISIVEVGFATALCAGVVALVWSYRRLSPQVELRARILQLESDSQAFSEQIIRLRTQKAGRASKARKEAEMAAQAQPADDFDADLEGLSAEEKALFM